MNYTFDISPAASIPAIAHDSSLSDESPVTPTAPITLLFSSNINTPPATGIIRPPDAAASPTPKCSRVNISVSLARDDLPIASPPHAFPKAISKNP